jgi:hypothetical protein
MPMTTAELLAYRTTPASAPLQAYRSTPASPSALGYRREVALWDTASALSAFGGGGPGAKAAGKQSNNQTGEGYPRRAGTEGARGTQEDLRGGSTAHDTFSRFPFFDLFRGSRCSLSMVYDQWATYLRVQPQRD